MNIFKTCHSPILRKVQSNANETKSNLDTFESILELVLCYKLEIGSLLEGCLSKQKTFVTHLVTE